ncbi:MAG TPA: hypothetical protein VG935_00755 [Patescibacteria group bacterium]|nr:hypothetical protein [Patescibacteria group bacterium]
MTKSPIINALAASLYIIIVALVMNFASSHFPQKNTFLAPIAVVSLFTLSAAVMAYIFLYQPIQLFMANKKDKAVTFFLQTLAVFACITVLIFALVFSGIIR